MCARICVPKWKSAASTILCGHSVTAVEAIGGAYAAVLSDGNRVATDKVMFAIGRRPNITGLGLEGVGVKIAARRRDRGR